MGGWPPGRPRSKLGGERNQKLQYMLHIQYNYSICSPCRFHIFNSSLGTMLTIYSPNLQPLFSYWHTMIQTQTWYVGNSIQCRWFFNELKRQQFNLTDPKVKNAKGTTDPGHLISSLCFHINIDIKFIHRQKQKSSA